jgi:Flp pilus assembly protein TadB
VTGWVILAGALTGLGVFGVIAELVPAGPRLAAALARLDSEAVAQQSRSPLRRLGQRLAAESRLLPVPSADLALLNQEPAAWMASKIGCGLLGLALPSLIATLALVAGHPLPWTMPVLAGLVCGAALFFAPDLVTRVNAAQKRADFRHSLASYLDLVALERGAGAGPTEALEAAALIGDGWAFERIAAALGQARKSGTAPWTALATLARRTGITELADLADIAEVAGRDGARILETLAARAVSMRAEALAAEKARAGSRSATMVIPVALLGAGFLILLIFPVFYRTFGAG